MACTQVCKLCQSAGSGNVLCLRKCVTNGATSADVAIVVCGKGSTTKSAAKSDPSLVSLRATVPSFGPAHQPIASIF